MKVRQKLIIQIEGKDAEDLKTGLQKITDKLKEPGFKRNDLTDRETEVIQNLTDKL